MKKISLILVLAMLTAILAGCGADTELEAQLSKLTQQMELLESRIAALEAENAALKAQLEADPNIPSDSNAFAPTAALMFGDWTAEDGILTVSGGFVRVADLSMDDGLMAEIHACDLILCWSGMELFKDSLHLHPGEASDSFELELEPLRYALPELYEGDELELNLEVTLSDGTVLTAWGGSWEYDGTGLVQVAG